MPMKLLVVEDDQVLLEDMASKLGEARFIVDKADKLEVAQELTDVNEYDCVVLDIGLPDGNGFEFVEQLRKDKNEVPVVIVTARGEVDDRVRGLDLGADDYIAKPFDANELIARVRALIRRNSSRALPVIEIGELKIEPDKHEVRVGGKLIELTAKEFAVLEYMARHKDQVVTRTMLMEHVWGSDFETLSNVIDVYIRNLRRKIEKLTKQRILKTVRGKGYVLTDKGASEV